MQAAQTRYSTFGRELLAIYLAIRHFRHLLEGRSFTIQTDHKPLTYAFNAKPDRYSPREIRHLDYISQFTTDIRYTPGSDNVVADALSRPDINALHPSTQLDLAKLANLQNSDPNFLPILSFPSFQVSSIPLPLQSGTIFCDMSTGSARPIVPEAFRRVVFAHFHGFFHPGIRATRKLISARFVWPFMNKDLTSWAKQCIACQRSKVTRHTNSPIGSFAVPDARFTHVHLDIVGPLSPSNGFTHILTMIDRFTRWPVAVPISDTSAETVAFSFLQHWEERSKVDDLRGTPMSVGTLEEIIDDNHVVVSTSVGSEHYVSILSFVDKGILEPGCSVLLNYKVCSPSCVLTDEVDPMVTVMKLEKAPQETYADIGGLEAQIQEIKESVELPLTHPELYEEMGIKPPKGVILYGAPGTGKTLLAKAVANQTSATFLRVVGSELIQKFLGDGPKLVRELFRLAEENAPSIVFIDEIDAVGIKRYESNSGGEREIQRTMLELLNQLDGFDSRGDVKVIMATNRIETLDPALIRPGRIDRKIEFPLPDEKTKRRIFNIHTSRMTLAEDVNLEEYVTSKDELSGADIKAICTEAGLLALRERRMKVTHEDFKKAKENVLYRKNEGTPEGLYL
ncbi:hypothetical protein T265_08645 [Opisthorchis viverrini]|uniref:26S proteasome regulatory subunit 4 homolog n=1 Tax=Opisthorchis viverrini TaxID=6198 RepID=A0A074Z8E1_OPIVI|nr:hypothetical protein T265_08645 [Opisthorchis viverrini]KER23481.1 hypothetical protein T265_08645 [Opisthorchis viverrini]